MQQTRRTTRAKRGRCFAGYEDVSTLLSLKSSQAVAQLQLMLWRYLREQMTRNRVYDTLTQQCQHIVAWLDTLPSEQVIHTLGGMTDWDTKNGNYASSYRTSDWSVQGSVAGLIIY